MSMSDPSIAEVTSLLKAVGDAIHTIEANPPTAESEKKEERPWDAAVWQKQGLGNYTIAQMPVDNLPNGIYNCEHSNGIGYFLSASILKTDKLVGMPNKAADRVIVEFDDFWHRKHLFDERGLVHKRGILLWGPPGSGKTSTLNILANKFIENFDGVVLISSDINTTTGCISMLRRIEPNRPILVTIEDIDTAVNGRNEETFLNLLDGNLQTNSIMFLATTNYPSRLDKRFTARPSRFDTILKVGMPDKVCREFFLREKEKSLTEDELQLWVKKTEGFSVSHLKELIIAVKCLGQDFEFAVKRLTDMLEPITNDDFEKRSVGFY